MATEITIAEHRRGRSRFFVYVERTREYLSRSAESGAVFGFLAVLIFFIITTYSSVDGWPPQIIDGRSIASIATNATSQGIIAVGVTMLMISGEFDLSVGSMLGLNILTDIPDDDEVRKSANLKVPVIMKRKDSPAAAAQIKLAQQISGPRVSEVKVEEVIRVKKEGSKNEGKKGGKFRLFGK